MKQPGGPFSWVMSGFEISLPTTLEAAKCLVWKVPDLMLNRLGFDPLLFHLLDM